MTEEQLEALFERYWSELEEVDAIRSDPKKAKTALIRIDHRVNQMIDKYSADLGFNSRSIYSHLAQIHKPAKLDEQMVYTLSELKGEVESGTDWIVPPLIPPGDLILLFGKAKCKKSLLAVYELAYAVSHGLPFLGFPTKKGKVLLFETEESKTSLKRRLKTKGFFDKSSRDIIDSDMVKVYRDFDLMTDLPRLQVLIDEEKPSLIVFDSLRKLMSKSGLSETHADFAKPVYALQSLLILNNVAGVLIHHGNKTTAAQSGIDSMAGTGALPGACFAIWQLGSFNEADRQEKRSVLSISPRDGDPATFILSHTSSSRRRWQFNILEEVGIEPDVIELEKKIARFLGKKSPQQFTYGQLARELNLPSDNEFYSRAIARCVDRSMVVSRDDFDHDEEYYFIPEKSTWHTAALVLEKEAVKKEQDEAERLQAEADQKESDEYLRKYLITATNKKEVKDRLIGVLVETKARVWATLEEKDKHRIKEMMAESIPAFEVDRIVGYKTDQFRITKREFYSIEGSGEGWEYELEGLENIGVPENELFEVEANDKYYTEQAA